MLHFYSDYDLAGFIVHVLALPVLIGCVLASTCLLARWADASLPLRIVYNAAVVLTFISFCFQIADSLAYASVDYSQRFESIQQRPLLILDVFAGSFDLIFRVATFAAVAYFTVTQSTDSARHRLMKSGSIAAVLILSALTIIGIAFRGVNEGYEEAYYSVVNTSSYLDYIQQERAVELWHLRIDQVQMAFYAVFLAAVLSLSVASFQARIRPLNIAIDLLLAMTVLETIATAWLLNIRTTDNIDDNYDGYGMYDQIAWILEIFFQIALLVTLLGAPRPLK